MVKRIDLDQPNKTSCHYDQYYTLPKLVGAGYLLPLQKNMGVNNNIQRASHQEFPTASVLPTVHLSTKVWMNFYTQVSTRNYWIQMAFFEASAKGNSILPIFSEGK